ncbi:hypothetical protein FACS1894217_07150 [Clostridia bacterium]|nr:hypothetical protein FACS1894217_07150 [Clostridia bacterium]
MSEENTTAAVAVKTATSGKYVHEFKTPFDYEGEKHKTMNFCFEKLTGRDMIAVEAEMTALGEFAIIAQISVNYLSRLAARAANIDIDVLQAIPVKDFNTIVNHSRNFFNVTD